MGGKKHRFLKSSKRKAATKRTRQPKQKSKLQKFVSLFCTLFCLVFIFVLIINLYIYNYSKDYVFSDIEAVPQKYTAIVPGASVYGDKWVSNVLRDRIEGAVDLIELEKAEKFLVSGDHGTKEYDEVNASRKYVQRMHDLKESQIFMDHAGFSTYETMYRARDVFCVTDCCIVTQKFHVYRSVYIARKLGLDAVGYIAPEITPFSKRLHLSWECREVLARVKAWFSVLFNVKPTYLGPQIPVTGDGRETWK